jgi:hypothetical protein
MSTSTDRVMQTVTRYFEVEAQDAGRACPVEEAARRASADPEFRDALARLLEADCHQGSFSACTRVSHCDSGVDAVAWLPDTTGCGTEQAYVLEAKVRDAAGTAPGTGSYLILLLAAAINVDRSSLGAADAWSLRREPSADDIAAVRKAMRRLIAGERTAPSVVAAEAEPAEREEPEHPGRTPDPLRASTPAEFTAALARYRRWAGNPSFREMARRAQPAASPSSLLAAARGERLPSLRVVAAFVTGCGGSPEELRWFTTAWRRLRPSGSSGRPHSEPQGNGTCPYASPPGSAGAPAV